MHSMRGRGHTPPYHHVTYLFCIRSKISKMRYTPSSSAALSALRLYLRALMTSMTPIGGSALARAYASTRLR